MATPVFLSIVLLGLFIAIGCWLGWQLLRQNGRILLRLDELEKRLNEIEFGDEREPEGLPLDSVAPEFELPDLEGNMHRLADYRGGSLLLILFNPECGFCREMTGKLREKVESRKQKVQSNQPMKNGTSAERTLILVVSSGGTEANYRFFKDHPVDCPVLLQQDVEVGAAYKANGTPTGYLISAEGKIASELTIGAEALLALAEGKAESRPAATARQRGEKQKTEIEQERTARFSQRSLARSRIKRDGLKAGTPAPQFRLPRLDGQGDLSLADFRGRKVLLVFSDPHCGPCQALAPELEKFFRTNGSHLASPAPRPSPPGEGEPSPAVQVVMISRGDPKENRAKVKEHGLTFPIVLQQQWEISREYAMFATPIAYLIDEKGVIAHDVAVGVDPILKLAETGVPEQTLA